MGERPVRRDQWGFGQNCNRDGCYEIGLEPDGYCDRHSPTQKALTENQRLRDENAALRRVSRRP